MKRWVIKPSVNPNFLDVEFKFGGDWDILRNWVALIKSVPDRVYDGERKLWIIPASTIYDVEKSLHYHKIPYKLMDKEVKAASLKLAEEKQLYLATKNYSGEPFDIPGLITKPFSYQYTGIAFLIVSANAVLADDMGCGKSLEAIAASLAFPYQYGTLIVCPSTLKWNWEKEIRKHTNEEYSIIDGPRKKRGAQWKKKARFYICSYELILKDIEGISDRQWDSIILDEATKIKTHKAKTTKAVKSLRSNNHFALTGTPIENKLDELHSLIDWVRPGILGSLYHFTERYVKKDFYGKTIGYKTEALPELRSKVSPYILRRTKEEVIEHLPPKTYENRVVEFNQAERREYRQLAREVMEDIFSDVGGGMVRSLRCKQFTTYPPIFASSSEGPKVRELDDILSDDDHKYLVFTEFTTNCIDRLAARYNAPYIAGPIPQNERISIIDRFNADPSQRVLFSSGVGSYGVEITGADVVVHLDTPWNPAVFDQRTDRAHRIGQTRPVHVIRLMVRNSIDDRIDFVMSDKLKLRRAILEEYDYEPSLRSFTKADWARVLTSDEE